MVTEVRVNKLTMNLVGILLTLLLCAGFIAFALLLPHYSSEAESHAAAVLVSFIAMIGLHEALHGLGLAWLGKVPWRHIQFGVMWRALMPYCRCTMPISVRTCRRMALLPLWVTGGITLASLLVFPSVWLAIITGTTIAACVGDVWIVAKLRRFPADWLVPISSSAIGCDVFPPATETVA
jgi:hypothetical protein